MINNRILVEDGNNSGSVPRSGRSDRHRRTLRLRVALVALSVLSLATFAACGTPQKQAEQEDFGAGSRDGDTLSFHLDSSTDIPTTKKLANFDGPGAACGAGFYVRAGGRSVTSPSLPAYPQMTVSNPKIEPRGTSSVINLTPKSAAYTAFFPVFYNSTASDQLYQFRWWCDAVTSWGSSSVGKNQPSAPGAAGVGPVGYNNDYKSASHVQILNAAAGLALDATNNGGQGTVLGAYPWHAGPNQLWDADSLGYADQVPAFVLWQNAVVEKLQIVENSDYTLQLASSQGGALSGSVWSWIDRSAMGPTTNGQYYGLQLISRSSRQCMTAPDPDNGAGGQGPVTTEPCDTHDVRQWWLAQYVN